MRVFCFATGVSSSHRRKLTRAILDLGDARLFHEDVDEVEEVVGRFVCPPSHLVVDLPTRSEKFMTGVGRGCWVVVMEYVFASRAAGTWLSELNYEVSPKYIVDSPKLLSEPDMASALSLVSMARCSRRLVAEVGVNLFVDWRVLLVVTGVSARDSRMEIFKNIVMAGGGVCYLVHLDHLLSFIAAHRDVTHVLGFGLDRAETLGNSLDRTKLQSLLTWKKTLSFILDSPHLISRAFDTIEDKYRRHFNAKKIKEDEQQHQQHAASTRRPDVNGYPEQQQQQLEAGSVEMISASSSSCLTADIAEGRPDEISAEASSIRSPKGESYNEGAEKNSNGVVNGNSDADFLRPMDPPPPPPSQTTTALTSQRRNLPQPPDSPSRSFSGISFDTSTSCKQQQQQQQQQQHHRDYNALATPTSITRKVALLTVVDAPVVGILKNKQLTSLVEDDSPAKTNGIGNRGQVVDTTKPPPMDRQEGNVSDYERTRPPTDSEHALTNSEHAHTNSEHAHTNIARKGVTFAPENETQQAEKTQDSDDMLPDLDDDDAQFNPFIMDVDETGDGDGDGGVDDAGQGSGGGVDEGVNQVNDQTSQSASKAPEEPALENKDIKTDEIFVIKRRRVRRPQQQQQQQQQRSPTDDSPNLKRPHSAVGGVDTMEIVDEPEEFSSPKKALLPWKPALRISTHLPTKRSLSSESRVKRKRCNGAWHIPLGKSSKQKPFSSNAASVFSQFTDSNNIIGSTNESVVSAASSNISSTANSSITSTTASSTNKAAIPASHLTDAAKSRVTSSWKEIVNGVESLFMATTSSSFPPPPVLRGLASTLATLDVTASMTNDALDDDDNLNGLSAPRSSDLGMTPIVELGMRYFRHLIRLFPPESTIISSSARLSGGGDGSEGQGRNFAPQDAYSQILLGFAGLTVESQKLIKNVSSRVTNAERRNRLLAWLVPKNRQLNDSGAEPSSSSPTSSSLLWTSTEKLFLNCLVEGAENSDCLPLAEIRRNILKQRRSLEFFSYVVDQVLTVNMRLFLLSAEKRASSSASSSSLSSRGGPLSLLPLIAQIFYPGNGHNDEPCRGSSDHVAGSSSSTTAAASFLPLSPHVRDFGRHLSTCISTCARRTIEPEVDARNLAALGSALNIAILLGEYARYRDWTESHAAGALTHGTYLGNAATSFASFIADILLTTMEEMTHDDDNDDVFLRYILRRLSVTLPWLACAVTQRVLDRRFSVRLLRDHLKPAPSQLLLYHIVSRYFYLIPRGEGEREGDDDDDHDKRSHTKISRLHGSVGQRLGSTSSSSSMSPIKRLATSSVSSSNGSPLRIVGENKNRVCPTRAISKIIRNKFGETKLHTACKKGAVELVAPLLASPDVLVNAQDNNFWTPMHEACNAGHVEIVRLLLNYKPTEASTIVAASFGRTDVERNPKVDLTAKSLEGITPLHDAVLCGRLEVVEALLETPAGLRVLWDHEAAEARGEKTHLELPYVSKFLEPAMSSMKDVIDAAMLRCRENGFDKNDENNGNKTCASSPVARHSSSQRLEDSQISEGSQSQNFCPSDSQYEDVFTFPTTPNSKEVASLTASSAISADKDFTPTVAASTKADVAKRLFFPECHTTKQMQIVNGTRPKSGAPTASINVISLASGGAGSVTSGPSSNKVPMKLRDIENLLEYLILLLTTYLDFMRQMHGRDDDDAKRDVDSTKGDGKSESSSFSAKDGDEIVYGDARIIRRLPKHVRSLNRHVNRLLANCQSNDSAEPKLSQGLKEKLNCLDHLLGAGGDP